MSQRQKQTQKAAAPKAEKQFSPTVITNFFNNYYRNLTMKKPDEQNISFKVYPTDKTPSEQLTIDLYKYQGLFDFIETYKEVLKMAEKEPEPEKAKKLVMDRVIDITFDMKLRACLDNARVYKTNDKSKINTFQEFIIPQLGFDTNNMMNIRDYINGVSSYFANESKLKTKIYNLVFPHDSHDPEKLPVGVNVIYLQHVSKYHDEVLDFVINKEFNEEKVLEEVQKLYAKDFKGTPEVKLQLLHPGILETVKNPPMISSKKGKQSVDPKWVDELKMLEVVKGKKKPEETEEPLTSEQKKAVRALYRELMIVKSFIKIINGGKNAREVKLVDGKQVAVPMKVNLKQSLKQYTETYGKITQFYDEWKDKIEHEFERIETEKEAGKITIEDAEGKTAEQIIAERAEEQEYGLFLRYFVESVRFIKNELGYNQPFKSFVNDVKKDVCFKFNKTLHAELEKLILAEEIDEEKIKELAATHHADWKFINFPKSYDPSDLSIYSKIGKFCGLDIKKEFRIAIGIALTAYIQEQIALIKAGNKKKKDVQIFIKTD